MRRWLTILAAGLGIAGLRAADWTVDAVSGDVQARRPGGEFAAVQAGQELALGTVLRTGGDGRATVKLDGRNSFVVVQDSTVRLEQKKAFLRPAGVRVVVENGRVESALPAWPAGRSYEVSSAAGAFLARGTAYAVDYKLGASGEFLGGASVSAGEVEYVTPECNVPSLTANGGMKVVRTVGKESVVLDLTAVGNDMTVVVGGKHRITVTAGTTVCIAVIQGQMGRFAAISVQHGVVKVGGQAVTPASGAVFIAGSSVLPSEKAGAFLDAARKEAGAYANLQLPGLTQEQIAALRAAQESAAQALYETAQQAGLLAMFGPPFIPERPIGPSLSPSGTP